jgi:leader peptidase (prepilin peptidase)/N-methyltransferase
VEIGSALMFVLMWLRYRELSAELVIYSLYLAIFVLIFVTDVEHRLILHAVTVPSLLFALAASFFTVTPLAAVLGALTGFVFFLLVFLLGERFFGAGAMGFGDVTLATVIGAMLGFPMVIVGLLVGIVTGGVIAGGMLLVRVRRMRSKVPYGPFLIAGGAATLLWGPQITTWLLY